MVRKIYQEPAMNDIIRFRALVIFVLVSYAISIPVFSEEAAPIVRIVISILMIAICNIWYLLEFVFYFKKRKKENEKIESLWSS